VRRGEIRWYTFATPDKRRPVLLLTRTSVIDTLKEHRRSSDTNHSRARDRGAALECGWDARELRMNFDHVTLVQRSKLGAVITELLPARWPEIAQD